MDTHKAPFLMRVLPSVNYQKRDFWHRTFILLFTFMCYTSYHLSRKPISVVKSVLHHKNCSKVHDHQYHYNDSKEWCDWAPFNHSNASDLLGYLDLAYLISYALAMFLSGHIADRLNLRYYLSVGMIGSGLLTIAFGLGYFYNIHTFAFYVIVQVIGGMFQSTGWPSVVACVGNWFGKGKRGLIMGVWNAHTSVGNILGSLIAGAFVGQAWGWSFVVPGMFIGFFGILTFLLLVPHPDDINCALPDHSDNSTLNNSKETDTETDTDEERAVGKMGDRTALLANRHTSKTEKPITIWKALMIPGVLEFAFCLFFAKLVSYTFLYWLPKYISLNSHLSAGQAAYTSTMFDVGGIVGAILAGYISDRYRIRGLTCVIFLIFSAPMLYLYETFGSHLPYYGNCLLLIVCGLGVNGPYALITTAVSADLGTHKSVRDNSKALGMVTAIIDGTGSIGAAIGPMLTGVISGTGWSNVFYMLYAAIFMAVVLLTRVVIKEIRLIRHGVYEDMEVEVPKSNIQGTGNGVKNYGLNSSTDCER